MIHGITPHSPWRFHEKNWDAQAEEDRFYGEAMGLLNLFFFWMEHQVTGGCWDDYPLVTMV